MSINKVTLIGRVGKDPEVKHLDTFSVANFSLATTERGYTTKSGREVPESTEWHNIVIIGQLANVVEKYVNKGDLLYLEGKIKTRSWDDNNGNKKYITEIHVSSLQMLGAKSKENQESAPNMMMEEESDNLPF